MTLLNRSNLTNSITTRTAAVPPIEEQHTPQQFRQWEEEARRTLLLPHCKLYNRHVSSSSIMGILEISKVLWGREGW
ncbi:hypothetical protein BOTCAL_0002g00800 [Botryotinia calthae]|uniref:Uncharacterized protein n=1 Tax=Botryotinia calthae TaxID=38488 RepID=A0A4Y8DI96_9HELO|nr:hypothetical protein BOTCAL_0002g00800 [Botryotinia calthae]